MLWPAHRATNNHHNNDDDDGTTSPSSLSRALARAAPPAAVTLLNLLGGGLGLTSFQPTTTPPVANAAAVTISTSTMLASAGDAGAATPAPFSPRDGKGKRVQEMNRRFARHVRAKFVYIFVLVVLYVWGFESGELNRPTHHNPHTPTQKKQRT